MTENKQNNEIKEDKKKESSFSLSSFAWSMIVVGGLLLVLLLVFIFQNLNDINIEFLIWKSNSVPLGLLLLCAALFGALFTALIAAIRIRSVKKSFKK